MSIDTTFHLVAHAEALRRELAETYFEDNDNLLRNPTIEQLLSELNALEAAVLTDTEKLHDACAIGYLLATLHPKK